MEGIQRPKHEAGVPQPPPAYHIRELHLDIDEWEFNGTSYIDKNISR